MMMMMMNNTSLWWTKMATSSYWLTSLHFFFSLDLHWSACVCFSCWSKKKITNIFSSHFSLSLTHSSGTKKNCDSTEHIGQLKIWSQTHIHTHTHYWFQQTNNQKIVHLIMENFFFFVPSWINQIVWQGTD